MVEFGMSPMDAIRAATSRAVNGDPLANVNAAEGRRVRNQGWKRLKASLAGLTMLGYIRAWIRKTP